MLLTQAHRCHIYSQNEVTLLDFWAAWCGPCKQLEPIVAELAADYAGRVKVAHVDVDKARNSAQKFRVMSVPTVLFMKDGQVKATQIGTAAKAKMIETIDKLL